jgi:SSS family solute:Na+ symporter
MQNFYGAIAAFLFDALVTVVVTYMGQPKPLSELKGLVWGCPAEEPVETRVQRRTPWFESPWVLGFTALGIIVVLSLVFI